ncbi:DUF6701 domain-containing protein [Vibrio sp. ABG19]|uniref:DUF6701 domain-containing protein n=1 Tax=Vibrio sp. ABG19 TaxID=2817385 RepID=UPI00249E24E1|nr:DUF6701 domain-containing protein [Vibrio sp. ABG19]WGY48579.1 MSHA biogenesis protein MshQ [Vibrio sp. ABG19]
MKRVIQLTLLLLLCMARPAFALVERCTVSSYWWQDTAIEFDVIGQGDVQQKLFSDDGFLFGRELWSTRNQGSLFGAEFNEPYLQKGVRYRVRLVYTLLRATYYIRNLTYGGEWRDRGSILDLGRPRNIRGDESIYHLNCNPDGSEPPIHIPVDTCDVFPQPVQSWKTAGSSAYAAFPPSKFNVQNAATDIRGWSPAYLADQHNIYHYSQPWQNGTSWDTLRIGFDDVGNEYIEYKNPDSRICNGSMGCYPGNDDGLLEKRKAKTPQPLNINFDGQDTIEINNGTTDSRSYQTVCRANSAVCSYSDPADGNIYIHLKKNLRSLYLNGWSTKRLYLMLDDGRKIETLTYGGNVALYFYNSARINFRTVSGSGSGNWYFESNAQVNIVDSLAPANALDTHYRDGMTGYIAPVFYGPRADMLLRSNNELRASVLAKSVTIPNYMNMQGSITTNLLTVSSGLALRAPANKPECWDGSSITSQYALTLQPAADYALICETQRLEFQVVDLNSLPSRSYSGQIRISPASSDLTLVEGKGSGSNGLYTPNSNGELWFDLAATASQTLTISGHLNPKGTSDSVVGTYHFVPYKLAAEDQRVIASKPQPVTITAQTCTADGSPKDLAYQGTPAVSSVWQAPANGVGELKFSPVFKDGEATADLVMDDSGIKTVLLEDSNFNCRELGDDCPIKGKGTLQGSFTVYSRPWTLAICSPGDSSAMDGNITVRNSTAFTAAGNTFGLNVRPLRWISGGAAQGEIETSGLCARPVTQNFFSSAAQLSAKAELSYRVAEPEDGANGTLNGELQRYNTSGVNDEYLPFSDLNWSEVGVLRVQAGLSDEYLGMTVNPGYREIGRFYPAWLSLSANDWDYPDGQAGFAYMNQPFGYGFSVEAQNSQGQVTQNYSSFDPALIADIKLLAVDSSGGDLGARIADYDLQFWDGSGSWSDGVLSGEHSLTFSKRVTNPSPYTTSADGPFSSGFGLRVTDKVDGVDFTSPQLTLTQDGTTVDRGAVFGSQPDIRYGRMVLDDVGGTTVSKINVPLRTEYWQGSRFVTNRDDNGSWFRSSANSVCRQSIWTADAGKFNSSLEPRQASLQIPTVAAGESDQLMATPHSEQEQNSVREQVRFWLRLDDSSSRSPQLADSSVTCGPQGADNPWLQYNWRGVGDEDPSAVVTFGVHRGNDRVIFRGEARLTGQ